MLATNRLNNSESIDSTAHSSESEVENNQQLTPMQSSLVRRNDIVMLKQKPCKIVEMNTSKPGKHGHSKIHFVGIDIVTGKKVEDICQTSKNVMVPEVEKLEYYLDSITDDDFILVKEQKNSEKKVKLRIPEGRLGDEIRNRSKTGQVLKITVIQAMGGKGVTACRPDK